MRLTEKFILLFVILILVIVIPPLTLANALAIVSIIIGMVFLLLSNRIIPKYRGSQKSLVVYLLGLIALIFIILGFVIVNRWGETLF